MGAEQSSPRDRDRGDRDNPQSERPPATKACYYNLLGVDRQATDEEIKKAYRRKALELHPDRNYGDVENTTKQFAEVQTAYEVLSDPQERAWYDSHRDAILRNDDLDEEHFEHDVRLTSAAEIIALMGRFTKRVPFADASNGFYGSLRTMFETLAREEDAASEWEGLEAVRYPDFGGAEESYKEVVRPFYAVWMSFTTRKTFAWLDTYESVEAPDRRIRRLMEKENKRLRDDGIKEFNDAVRSLAAFARKRDPRFVPNTQSEADRQKTLRGAAVAQAIRSRAANQAKLDGQTVPEWMRSQEPEAESLSDSGSEPSDEEHFECVTCGKVFKSEKQYETHEKSKKHIKAVQLLKKQMEKENKLFKLDSDVLIKGEEAASLLGPNEALSMPLSKHLTLSSDFCSPRQATSGDVEPSSFLLPQADQPEKEMRATLAESRRPMRLEGTSKYLSTSKDDLDEDYALKEEIEARLSGLAVVDDPNHSDKRNADISDAAYSPMTLSGASDKNGEGEQTGRLGKAKVKRAKKAARHDPFVQNDISCATCNEVFDSKTRLFRHIKELGHAQPGGNSEKGKENVKTRRFRK